MGKSLEHVLLEDLKSLCTVEDKNVESSKSCKEEEQEENQEDQEENFIEVEKESDESDVGRFT